MQSLGEHYVRTGNLVSDAMGLLKKQSGMQLDAIARGQRQTRVIVGLRLIAWIVIACGFLASLLIYSERGPIFGVLVTGFVVAIFWIVTHVWLLRDLPKPGSET
jgi:hypothetical protein